jgi:hypothetical protein
VAAAVGLTVAVLPSAGAAAGTARIHAADARVVVPTRGAAGPAKARQPLLLYHGGEILTSSVVHPIFWGSSWSSPTFTGDKMSGLDTLYGGLSGTSYAGTNTEYYGTNGQVGTTVTYTGDSVDTSAGPSHAPKVSDVLAEVARTVGNPVANGYYPVYVDLPRGHAGYCAWHSYGTINNVPVQFGFFFNLDGDPGCDPESTYSGSQGLKALANVSGHEYSETITDPRNGGWWDSSGAENADKCAWTFSGSPVRIGRTDWKIQGNFSNAAYNAHSGYDGAGCIDR